MVLVLRAYICIIIIIYISIHMYNISNNIIYILGAPHRSEARMPVPDNTMYGASFTWVFVVLATNLPKTMQTCPGTYIW